nr:hypothetical protein [Allorhizocola rhizosphaerae]
MHQAAVRGFVNVFLGRDQLRAGSLDGQGDIDVVLAVSGQPIDLLDDHVVNVAALSQLPNEPLQIRAVDELGALARVDELIDHVGVQVVSRPEARLSLRLDGVAVGVEVGLGLIFGGHSQVDEGLPSPGETGCVPYFGVEGALGHAGPPLGSRLNDMDEEKVLVENKIEA